MDSEVGVFSEAGSCTKRATDQTIKGYYCEMKKQNVPLLDAIPRVSMNSLGIVKHVGRQLFATGKGMLGLGPSDVKSGDLVCVFPGFEVPFVLCMVHDLNDGRNVRTKWEWLWKRKCFRAS